jgi:LmeA-like phospholipid-binding
MRRLIIALLVVVGLFVAVDFGSAALAESAVSRQMREQIGLVDDPSVRINGFPFLTQAVSGRYSSVDVTASRIRVGEMQELDVAAQLRDVGAPLSMLLGPGPKTLDVQEAEGTVRVPAADVERLVDGVEDLRIETIDDEALEQAVEDGGPASLTQIDPEQAARFGGTVTVLGQQIDLWLIAVLQLVDGQVQIEPRYVHLGDDAPVLPAVAQSMLEELFTIRVNPGALPLAVTPTDLRAVNGALEISGTAENLTLGAAAIAATG